MNAPLKTTFTKLSPNILQYRKNKWFEIDSFLKDIESYQQQIGKQNEKTFFGGKHCINPFLLKQKWFEDTITLLFWTIWWKKLWNKDLWRKQICQITQQWPDYI